MQHYQRIRDLREDHDLTQEALCNFYDVSLDYIAGRTNIPVNRHTVSLHEDAAAVLQKYTALTERNKGKLEQFLDTLFEQQAQQKEAQ